MEVRQAVRTIAEIKGCDRSTLSIAGLLENALFALHIHFVIVHPILNRFTVRGLLFSIIVVSRIKLPHTVSFGPSQTSKTLSLQITFHLINGSLNISHNPKECTIIIIKQEKTTNSKINKIKLNFIIWFPEMA